MKKNILIGLGLLLVAGAGVTFVSASRYAYHVYQQQQLGRVYRGGKCINGGGGCTVYRVKHNTNRVSPWVSRRNRSRIYCSGCGGTGLDRVTGRYDTHLHAQYRPGSGRINFNKYRHNYKLNHPDEFARYANTFQTERIIVRRGDYKVTGGYGITSNNFERVKGALENVHASQYLTAIPAGFVLGNDNIYRKAGTSLAFRVVKTPDTYSCTSQNFWSCSINLTKGFKRNNDLSTVSQTYQKDFRWNQTNLATFDYYPTVTEAFKATSFGKTNQYYVLNALDPRDGQIVRIEAVSTCEDSVKAAKEIHQVFEAFRLKP